MTIDFSTVPAIVTITNETDRKISVQFYKSNQQIELAPADILKIRVESSEALFNYVAKQSQGLTVEYAKAE